MSERNAKLITDQNIFVTIESVKPIRYFQEDLQSLISTLPTLASRISKTQIGLVLSLMGTAFSAINAVQINKLQTQSDATNKRESTLTHISQIQEDHLNKVKATIQQAQNNRL
jgi:hypothetical protein